ncbi:MAG TPA: hypothetical protein VK558_06660 [Patescibacteria group bacterium]|nr:hypothetical protein [Patescibacteria group bacterium]
MKHIARVTELAAEGPLYIFGAGPGGEINPPLIDLWADLLTRVENSRLILCNEALRLSSNRSFLRRQFAERGIGGDRLEVRAGVDREAIKLMYGEIDISLDTWPYCGGNTIAESLMSGVPVVSLLGDTFAARYGASLLTASGCPELVAATRADYVDIAAALAGDPHRLAAYRSGMRAAMQRHGFSDSARFVRDLECAFAEMLSRLPV